MRKELGPFGVGEVSPGASITSTKPQVLKAIRGLERGTPIIIKYSSDGNPVSEVGYFDNTLYGDIGLSRKIPIEESIYSEYKFRVSPVNVKGIHTLETGKSIYP